MKDDYVHLFVKRPVRRSPIINRGYFSRWAAFRKLMSQFLLSGTSSKKQILSLGAGFDTTYFQLLVRLLFLLLFVSFYQIHHSSAYSRDLSLLLFSFCRMRGMGPISMWNLILRR
jgi:hypothetical protein